MSTNIRDDRWARWVLDRQFGHDAEARKAGLAGLEGARRFRDQVLDHAAIKPGDVVLDVGCGSGLLGFGALTRVGDAGTVIFSDVSQELLDHCRSAAEETGDIARCQFVMASADSLKSIANASTDVVMTRSVLIYVKNKRQAFSEFHRILRSGGRVSIFEPINRFGYPEPPGRLWGYDIRPIQQITQAIRDAYAHIQPAETDPMLDFDERDLVAFAEQAGFFPISLHLEAEIKALAANSWDEFLSTAGNPLVPTVGEIMRQTMAEGDAERLTAYLRPLVELGHGTWRMAYAYLWATKSTTQARADSVAIRRR